MVLVVFGDEKVDFGGMCFFFLCEGDCYYFGDFFVDVGDEVEI